MNRLAQLGYRIKRQSIVATGTAAGLICLTFPSSVNAHHSWARYDAENIITVTGTVTRVEWANPHVIMAFDVTGDDGRAVEWVMEMDPPILLNRYGLRHDAISQGMEITITGVGARSGAPVMRAVTITLSDGTVHRVSSRV
jgi:hypothetical protein